MSTAESRYFGLDGSCVPTMSIRFFAQIIGKKATIAILNNTVKEEHFDIEFREFDAIEFYRGVPYFDPESPRMLIECHGICAGFGRPELGSPKDRRAFILKLGLLIETHNCDNLKIN